VTMTETSFSINDLLRRKLQTGLTIIGLALCVTSTLFLVLLGDRLGLRTFSVGENKLTVSFASVFSQFILFTEFLVFAVGTATISFLIYAMMSQRTRDVGLMKAAGCPNDLVFSYFVTELIIVVLIGCSLGVALGITLDYVSSGLLCSVGSHVIQWQINLWVVLITFAVFVLLSLAVGMKPILDATKVRPAVALSPSFSLGLNKESNFKGVAKAGLTMKIAIRSLFRRRSASFRILLCLTLAFVLVTVSVAGGIIAKETTRNWVERAVDMNAVLIAHHEMIMQYESLLSRFYTGEPAPQFNYSNLNYSVPDKVLDELRSIPELKIDPRLIVESQINELQGIIFGDQTSQTTYVGDNRKGTSLIVGVEPDQVLGQWFLNGDFLGKNQTSDAVIGDTAAAEMFSQPLVQSLMLLKRTFQIVGVCVDPINNGNLTYVPLETLENITNISRPNILLVEINDTANRKKILNELEANIATTDPDLSVYELSEVSDKLLGFLDYMWSPIMLLPVVSLSAVTLCLISYLTLAVNEQRQEFGILRAVGAKPMTVVKIVIVQSLLVSLSSWAAGLALGIITTLLVLIPKPFVTANTIVEIVAWLLAALTAVFISSLFPAVSFVRKPIVHVMAHD
jgi:ABC-type antimicrobial peptide transport system permease subunit